MTVRRLFLPPARIGERRASLTPEAAHYLRDVLRLNPGAPLELFDGEGAAYPAEVEEGFESLRIVGRREVRPSLALSLLVALCKGEKMDWVVQKATELGATAIHPFAAERSVVRLDRERGGARAVRWRRIAAEAARQSGRADVPVVAEPSTLAAALASVPEGFARFVFDLGGEPLGQGMAVPGVAAVLGPEGGLAVAEVEACEAAGARRVSLGPRVLRAETAALVVTALLQARFGDLG